MLQPGQAEKSRSTDIEAKRPECRKAPIKKGQIEQNIESNSSKTSKKPGKHPQPSFKKTSDGKIRTKFNCFSKAC
jgi:hypothetical protein